MAKLEIISFTVALVSFGVATLLSALSLILRQWISPQASSESTKGNTGISRYLSLSYLAKALAAVGLLFLTTSMVSRWVLTGHGPFSSIYEFATSFSWGIMVMGLFFERRYRAPAVRAMGVLMATALLLFANTLPSKPVPLVPALQQSFLLTTHVAAATIAYGTFAIGFGAAALYLIQERYHLSWMPNLEALDDMSYHTAIIGFPFLTLCVVLGAIWADIAWGRFWGWDPKETASLVTWLLYASYLHARAIRGWRGTRAAILLIVGFLAILLTFFGNYIFSGLHSYK